MIDLGLGHVRVQHPSLPGAGPRTTREYGPPAGLAAARRAVAEWAGVPPERVALTTGASLGLVATLATLPRPASVLCPRPHFPAYAHVPRSMGIEVSFYDLEEELGWMPSPEGLARAFRPDTRAVLWNFPNNPTGSVASRAALEALARLVAGRDVVVVSDEVYGELVYDPADGMPELTDHVDEAAVVRLRSFSKSFGIPGDRLGYVVAVPDRLEAISRAHWHLAMSPPASAQLRIVESLRDEPRQRLDALGKLLREHRDRAVEILSSCARLRVRTPAAGLFCWVEVLGGDLDSRALARACAERAGVTIVPGVAFGIEDRTFFRASFAVPRDELETGMRALVELIDETASEKVNG